MGWFDSLAFCTQTPLLQPHTRWKPPIEAVEWTIIKIFKIGLKITKIENCVKIFVLKMVELFGQKINLLKHLL